MMDSRPKGGGGMSQADVEMRPFELLSVVCTLGGVECPLLDRDRVGQLIETLRAPACRLRLVTPADDVPHYTTRTPDDWKMIEPQEVLNRKRDLDILQKLGLTPGAVVRSRYAFEWLFRQVETLLGVCAYDTPGWEGCPHAREGVYEGVREKGAAAVVSIPDKQEIARRKAEAAREIREADHLYIQPHILMCICCDYNGSAGGRPRAMDEVYELRQKMEQEPDIDVTLVEGDLCMVCGSCDGFDTEACRCVHAGGLIRNFKKNLDAFQRLGLMPGATLTAREAYALIFERIPSTRLVCGYGDGKVTALAWSICGGPEGHPGYERTRAAPFIP